MKKFTLFLFATLFAGSLAAQNVTYSYTVTDTIAKDASTPTTGGTITFGADKFEKANGVLAYKLDGDISASSTKYVLVEPTNAFQAGDVIKVGGFCTSSLGSAGIGIFAARANNEPAIAIHTMQTKNTTEYLTYTVQATDAIVGKNQLYIFRNGKSSYFLSVEITSAPAAKDDATLKSITVNGKEVDGFAPGTTTYNIALPFGTTQVPVVAATATSSKATVSVTQAESVNGTATITVKAEDGTTQKTYTINFSVAAASQDATLSAITVDGEALEGFSPEQLTYSMELAYGTTIIPTVTATTTDKNATYIVKYVDAEGAETTSLPCTATITVTAEDNEVSQTYSIAFTVDASASSDATLASISIDGKAIADFKADSLDYTHTIAYAAKAIPEVTAVVHDETANINITQAVAVPGTATIVVTAQAGNTQTYTVAIKRAAALKHLLVVPFTNGAKGAINETALTVTAPYLDGTDVPTVDGEHIAVSGDGTPTATLSEDGAKITLKGTDDVEAVYTVVTTALSPETLTAEEKTFTGKETYIFAPYGWASDKGWKFAKKVNDEGNMRDAKGNTRIYMALPPAESVKLTSGSGGARSVVIYVNGATSDIETTAASGSTITISLNSTTNNFVAIESNQTSGDGGFTKIQLVNPSNPIGSAVEQAQVVVKAVKVIRDGQLLIIREGKTYTAQGMQVQ